MQGKCLFSDLSRPELGVTLNANIMDKNQSLIWIHIVFLKSFRNTAADDKAGSVDVTLQECSQVLNFDLQKTF